MPIQWSCVQNHWVAPRLTQPFILLRLIKWVPGTSGNLVVKSKLSPRSDSGHEAVEPHPWKKKKLFKSIETCDTTVCSDFSSLIVENIKEKVLLQNTKTEQETTQIFLKKIWVYLTKQSSNSKKLQGDSQKMSCGIKFALAD